MQSKSFIKQKVLRIFTRKNTPPKVKNSEVGLTDIFWGIPCTLGVPLFKNVSICCESATLSRKVQFYSTFVQLSEFYTNPDQNHLIRIRSFDYNQWNLLIRILWSGWWSPSPAGDLSNQGQIQPRTDPIQPRINVTNDLSNQEPIQSRTDPTIGHRHWWQNQMW